MFASQLWLFWAGAGLETLEEGGTFVLRLNVQLVTGMSQGLKFKFYLLFSVINECQINNFKYSNMKIYQ